MKFCQPSQYRRRQRESRGGAVPVRRSPNSRPSSARAAASPTSRITPSACSVWTAAAWMMSSGAFLRSSTAKCDNHKSRAPRER